MADKDKRKPLKVKARVWRKFMTVRKAGGIASLHLWIDRVVAEEFAKYADAELLKVEIREIKR